MLWALALLTGCVDNLSQVAGTGATYTVRCSAAMEVLDGEIYRARCEPAACAGRFESGPVSHVVVAVEPGAKLYGYAERVCIQDLSSATGLFHPALVEPPEGGNPAPTPAIRPEGPAEAAPAPATGGPDAPPDARAKVGEAPAPAAAAPEPAATPAPPVP